MRRKKETPEERATRKQYERESDERLRRLREVVDRGFRELEERREREHGSTA